MIDTSLSTFSKDVNEGLSSPIKYLSSKYFYNAEGDRLFQKIMAMPEYYLTNCEAEILEEQADAIRQALGTAPLDIIELGAGDGSKTKLLLKNLIDHGLDIRYIPSDISPNILAELKTTCAKEIPGLEVVPLAGDYFESLVHLPDPTGRKRVMLYFGANIGNLEIPMAAKFLKTLRQFLSPNDFMFIGFDLKKDPQTILNAYNDPTGYTAAFNLNLLKRINEELGANFKLDQFQHWERYNPETGAARSYLVSNSRQEVFIHSLNKTFEFRAWESIRMELSQKYGRLDIESLAEKSGYKTVENFVDKRSYFVDSLWRPLS